MLANKLLSAAGSSVDKLYVDDVFSAYTYTGNGSTQTINNGIDLAGKGGLVWTMGRQSSNVNTLIDTARGAGQIIRTHMTDPASSYPLSITSFNGNGYSLGADQNLINRSDYTGLGYVSHTFRRAPKFFDVVTYTGNGVAGRQIPHSLGVAPGMVIVKCTNQNTNWFVYHASLPSTSISYLNSNAAVVGPTDTFGSHTATDIILGNSGNSGSCNLSGSTYVAYLFAHDPSADGIIQCGSVTQTGAPNAGVTLGWEPQFVMAKASSTTDNWHIWDASRGMPVDGTLSGSAGNDKELKANTSGSETSADSINPRADGFNFNIFGSTQTFVYLAIRRPNKPPTTGTQVYNAIARTGTGAAATVTGVGFAPDVLITKSRNNSFEPVWFDRLRGAPISIKSNSTNLEQSFNDNLASFDMSGITVRAETLANLACINAASYTYINHFFKRAPGFFDVVCYTGTGGAQTVNHSLGVAPELMIVKNRTGSYRWAVYSAALGNAKYLNLHLVDASTDTSFWNNTSPTASVFTLGVNITINDVGGNYVAYLFATKPGISKVGSYTGNGSSQTINCGFSAGARFFLVKAASTTGSWWIFDSVRGIISAADPALQLNSTAAEITSADAVDPHASGLIVNQEVTCSINATGASYVFLAIS